jgi:hypothetical protein
MKKIFLITILASIIFLLDNCEWDLSEDPIEIRAGEIWNITATTAGCMVNIINSDSAYISYFGVCYGTVKNPDINGARTASNSIDKVFTGSFPCYLTGLNPHTKYYVRSYVVGGTRGGLWYGNTVSFTTLK